MTRQGNNYKLISLQKENREELHDKLELTGCEISINTLPKGVSVPFVHAHKQNEEIYIVVKGYGELFIDGDEFRIKAGDVISIKPKGERCFKASNESELKFICIQAKAGSLEQFTMSDGEITAAKPSWF
ncbi:cupin domain-containing protein [Campylobacter sp.]|uniref:cupin domain-containing protein n=1 Tax=Campylobacter sp. TaxID=205 RepID=UPI002701C806|nr:cupin domain-containing protein [Campylobacter sp.]